MFYVSLEKLVSELWAVPKTVCHERFHVMDMKEILQHLGLCCIDCEGKHIIVSKVRQYLGTYFVSFTIDDAS